MVSVVFHRFILGHPLFGLFYQYKSWGRNVVTLMRDVILSFNCITILPLFVLFTLKVSELQISPLIGHSRNFSFANLNTCIFCPTFSSCLPSPPPHLPDLQKSQESLHIPSSTYQVHEILKQQQNYIKQATKLLLSLLILLLLLSSPSLNTVRV